MRKLGEVFGLCSDEIDLGPSPEIYRTPPHRARAERRPGELVPGRDRQGRAMTRGVEAVASGREERSISTGGNLD